MPCPGRTSIALLLACLSCEEPAPVADLPAGWEAAEPVEALVQQPCEGSAIPADPVVTADFASDPLEVLATALRFRCEQAVEGFWQQPDDEVQILVQPVDLEPETLALCDCRYDVQVTVGSPERAPSAVAVWQRQDSVGGAQDPVEVGRAEP